MSTTTTTPTTRVLDYKRGQAFLPAVGTVVDATPTGPWHAVAVATGLLPALYAVEPHVISAEPNRQGRVSANAGKPTVKVIPLAPGTTLADHYRDAVTRAEDAVTAAQARVTAARAALAAHLAAPAATPTVAAPVVAAPAPTAAAPAASAADALAALAGMTPDALAALLAGLKG